MCWSKGDLNVANASLFIKHIFTLVRPNNFVEFNGFRSHLDPNCGDLIDPNCGDPIDPNYGDPRDPHVLVIHHISCS